MPVLTLRGNQNTPLDCQTLDNNFLAVLDRSLHTGTQLSSTISDLYTTVENYDFIAALQQCCTELTNQLTNLQDSIFGDGELSVLINNLRNDLLLEITQLQADLTALTLRVTTAETNIATINSSLVSISNSITSLQNSKANINSPTFTGIPKAPTPLAEADPNQIATVGYITSVGGSLPVGAIIPYGGSVVPDDNFMFANGQAINRTTYNVLFSRFGTTYGAGDGSSTFNLPNLEQKIPVGVGIGFALGSTGGEATHTLTESELPAHSHSNEHTHTVEEGAGHSHDLYAWKLGGGSEGGNSDINVDSFLRPSLDVAVAGEVAGVYPTNKDYISKNSADKDLVSTSTTGITISSSSTPTSNTGGGAAHNNMQPYIVLNYIVKVK